MTNPAAEQTEVQEGQVAPDFTLRDHLGNEFTLSAYRGKNPVVLATFALAFTSG
ncbi:MAG: redoxin domain-containing protein [Chloroflexota bacterium]|nr:redoxin domain-containing protein [Dehalococcoidia bacterium]MDW8253328.1 redoxin domain-containing protein [Chloroflexota bacterium]